MPKRDFTRRQILRGAGGFSLALPALVPRQGRAAQAGVPKRLVLFYIPEGCNDWSMWFPIAGKDPTDFSLKNQSVAPLEPYKGRLTFVKGLHLESSRLDGSDLHGLGHKHVLTGGPDSPAVSYTHPITKAMMTAPGGISMDQLVAAGIKGEAPFSSFEFGILSNTASNPAEYVPQSYDRAKTPRFPVDSPYRAYQTLFGGGKAASPDLAKAAEEAQNRHLSVIDLVSGELGSLKAELGCDALHKLDSHLAGIREIEKQLRALYAQKANASVTPVTADADKTAHDGTKVPQIVDLQMSLAVSALQADLVRVVTVMIGRTYGLPKFPFVPGLNPKVVNEDQHAFSHNQTAAKDTGLSVAEVNVERKKIATWYAAEFKSFLDKLDAVKEPNGKSLLDNSLVLHFSDFAHGNHGRSNYPIILGGGGQGAIKLGRNFDLNPMYDNVYRATAPSPMEPNGSLKTDGSQFLAKTGRSLNDLHLTIFRAMGITGVDRFGYPAASYGPITDLLA